MLRYISVRSYPILYCFNSLHMMRRTRFCLESACVQLTTDSTDWKGMSLVAHSAVHGEPNRLAFAMVRRVSSVHSVTTLVQPMIGFGFRIERTITNADSVRRRRRV